MKPANINTLEAGPVNHLLAYKIIESAGYAISGGKPAPYDSITWTCAENLFALVEQQERVG